jgi:hypothetical protein
MEEAAEDLRKLEFERKQLKEFLERSEALARLENNADFKAIILDWFLEKEAIRLVHLQGTPGAQVEATKNSIERQLIAISGLSEKFRMIKTLGNTAKADLITIDETQEEILTESRAV